MKPKRSPKQVSFVKLRTRKLYDNLLYRKSVCIIRDNETYVKYDYKTLPGDQFYTVKDGQSVDKAETSIFPKNSVKRPWFGKLYVNVACSPSRLWQLTQWSPMFTSRNAWTAAYCPWSRSMMVQYCFCRIWQQFTTQGTRWLSTNEIMSSSYENWWIRQTVLKRKLLKFFGSNSKHTWGNTSS